jgi:hypothetical protein
MAAEAKRSDRGAKNDSGGEARRVIESAKEQLSELTGKEPESVSAIRRTDDGWKVTVEVVEARRIPDTTSILASYEVIMDEDGGLLEYGRTHRYARSATGGEDE